MTPEREFDGPRTAPGVVRGVRAFRVDRWGRLTGVTVRRVFRPGENIAECTPTPDAVERPAGEHKAGVSGCTCGYWAHYDGRNTYSDPGTVTAIIEGYGQVTLGRAGFRAEKARVVALVVPHEAGPAEQRCMTLYSSAGVALYPNLTAALAEHAVTHHHSTGNVPSPETDAEFWDRAIGHDLTDDDAALWSWTVANLPPGYPQRFMFMTGLGQGTTHQRNSCTCSLCAAGFA